MAMNEKLVKEVNLQINRELESAYIYMALSAKCEALNLEGFANWFSVQSDEEVKHAMKFYKHLIDREQKVEFEAIKKPYTTAKTVTEMFKVAYEHEKYITDSIHKLQDVAQEVNDKDIIGLIDWFNNEQIEEEKSTSSVLKKLEFVKEHPGAVMMLDAVVGKREGD